VKGDFLPGDHGAVPALLDHSTPAGMEDCALRLIGNSAGMQKVRELISRVAPTDSTVLICGESGVGKELVAEAVHAMSPRSTKPFVALNCAAIPATLIEAELFGHERGSFTGALRTREGVFERANGGTLLLDEITEMPLDLQSRLLRVLETKHLNRVGGSTDLPVDVRVIASTNRLPSRAFEEGRLREDIYYRLAVVTIELPPLRNRGEDILVLADFFLGELNLRNGTRKRLSGELRERFARHRWPGNVRELRNAVERAYILCDGELNLSDQEMPTLRGGEGASTDADGIRVAIGTTLDEIERTLILATLRHFEGDKRRAADVLGCRRTKRAHRAHKGDDDGNHSMVGNRWCGRLARQHRHEARWQSGHHPECRRRHRWCLVRWVVAEPDARRALHQFRRHQHGQSAGFVPGRGDPARHRQPDLAQPSALIAPASNAGPGAARHELR
jgi:DNA-binding NtrC family response regulator